MGGLEGCGNPFEEAGMCCWLTEKKRTGQYILFGLGFFFIFFAAFVGVL
jgi:hypothetical protein